MIDDSDVTTAFERVGMLWQSAPRDDLLQVAATEQGNTAMSRSSSTRERPPAVAGMFYPADASQLRGDVDALLAARGSQPPGPKRIVGPHAGYVYSGAIAAAAYAQLRAAVEHVHRVVLIGPSHRVAFRGLAVPEANAFATPLGVVPIDRDAHTAA